MDDGELFDVIIIGGGIGGVISLKYAKDANLKVLLLESKSGVGGLWRDLPSWQDIQFSRLDWTLGEIPIAGEDQASILGNIEAWVEHFQLNDFVRPNSRVTSARREGDAWTIATESRTYRSRYVISATGGHNRPVVPDVERSGASIEEHHSSDLRDPTRLTGKTIAVVGGGASAYDLLDLCLEYQAKSIIWIYRTVKWMMPTRKSKHDAVSFRVLAKQQMIGVPSEKISREVNQMLRQRYERAGLQEILPDHDFDFRHDQFIPGRYRMIKNFAAIERHRGEVTKIDGNELVLSDGTRRVVDAVLWGTGYTIDLSYFAADALAGITRQKDLRERCNDLFASSDAQGLYLLAPSVLESTTSTTWAYSHACRSIVSEISGRRVFGRDSISDNVTYFDLAKFLAKRDHKHFPPALWFLKYFALAYLHPRTRPMPIP